MVPVQEADGTLANHQKEGVDHVGDLIGRERNVSEKVFFSDRAKTPVAGASRASSYLAQAEQPDPGSLVLDVGSASLEGQALGHHHGPGIVVPVVVCDGHAEGALNWRRERERAVRAVGETNHFCNMVKKKLSHSLSFYVSPRPPR
jgi:hypothetical protein